MTFREAQKALAELVGDRYYAISFKETHSVATEGRRVSVEVGMYVSGPGWVSGPDFKGCLEQVEQRESDGQMSA